MIPGRLCFVRREFSEVRPSLHLGNEERPESCRGRPSAPVLAAFPTADYRPDGGSCPGQSRTKARIVLPERLCVGSRPDRTSGQQYPRLGSNDSASPCGRRLPRGGGLFLLIP